MITGGPAPASGAPAPSPAPSSSAPQPAAPSQEITLPQFNIPAGTAPSSAAPPAGFHFGKGTIWEYPAPGERSEAKPPAVLAQATPAKAKDKWGNAPGEMERAPADPPLDPAFAKKFSPPKDKWGNAPGEKEAAPPDPPLDPAFSKKFSAPTDKWGNAPGEKDSAPPDPPLDPSLGKKFGTQSSLPGASIAAAAHAQMMATARATSNAVSIAALNFHGTSPQPATSGSPLNDLSKRDFYGMRSDVGLA